MTVGPFSLLKSAPVSEPRLVVEVSSKNLEREAGGGVCTFGAWCLFQYSSAKAHLCLSVKWVFLFFFGDGIGAERLTLPGRKKALKVSDAHYRKYKILR